MLHRALLICVTVLATAANGQDRFTAFPVDWKSQAPAAVDLSSLLEAPAGKNGPVSVSGGHLVDGAGKRLRLWGLNATMAGALPAKENAPLIARRLAEAGVNCIRFHFLDVPAPRGLLDPNRPDTQAFDPTQLDRLDFFIAQLKTRGIYSDLNLNVAHPYKPGDGVADCELLGFAKALTYFDERLLELQYQYARMLLTHRNPYTQSVYATEPAIAMVELLNENSLVESWFSGRLQGKNTTKNPGGWTDIPASYEARLTQKFNDWLKQHLSPKQLEDLRAEAKSPAGQSIPRLQVAEFSKASAFRFQTEASFYMDVEQHFFMEMAKYLAQDLGVKAPLVGCSDHNHGRSGYPHVCSTSLLDIVDGHVYWQHPSYISDPKTGRHTGFRIENTPMVADPRHSTVVQLSRTAIAKTPYIVSEVNHPFPAESACEGLPILAAYASLQDWDGIFWYTLGHKDPVEASASGIGHFDLYPDAVKMSQLRAGAMMFLRADVASAKQTIMRSYSKQQVIESLRLNRSEWPYFTPGFDGAIPLTHAVRVQSFDDEGAGGFEHIDANPIVSDTGELAWHAAAEREGMVTIDTARSQALIGHAKAMTKPLANLSVKLDTPFAAITLTAMDDKPIAQSSKLLLTACGRVANTGMNWDAKRHTLEQWGREPACIEPIAGSITLRNLDLANAVSAQPLDGIGAAMGPVCPLTKTQDAWQLPLGAGGKATTWYLITVGR